MARTARFHWIAWSLLGPAVLIGCASRGKSVTELDASQLLELIQEQQPGDERSYGELDLGRFRITHALASEGQVLVQFHLFALLPPQQQAKLEERLPKYDKRIRDAVISLVQRTETEHLTDASLAFFKTELVGSINEVVQDRLVADVAFSDYSIDPTGTGAAWSTPAAEVKPAGGHGGGGHGGGGHGGGGHGGHGH